MSEGLLHTLVAVGVMVSGLCTLLLLQRVSAPYGRHIRAGWGPTLPSRLGWLLMESPAVFAFLAIYVQGAQATGGVPLLLLGVWMLHYGHRALLFPFRLRIAGRRMPLSIALSGFVYNLINAWLNARQISHLGDYGGSLGEPRLWLGLGIFGVGWIINLHADTVLIRLRAAGEGYRIPQGGLYRWISCPNYLGEMVLWVGWAIATGSLAGLSFAVFTMTNLGPRALSHHRWYQETFPDYPPARRALLPFLL